MADIVVNGQTSLPPEEVIVRAVQFFSTEKFKTSSQSPRTATFEGRPPIPWGMLTLTVIGLIACVIPGIILYVMMFRKMYRFHNLVVAANPTSGGTEVVITHPDWAGKPVARFLEALPPVEDEAHDTVER